MRRQAKTAFPRATLVALALALLPAGPASAGLAQRLDAALDARELRGARVAALVVGADDGHELYARDPDRALVPASNQKILTALSALSAWGPTHGFVTEVLAPSQPDAEGAVPTLWIRGGGDPAMTSEQWWRLAADLRARGLRRVRGDLVMDDGAFDRERWHPSWGAISSRAYHAPIGALTANYGTFTVWASPGAAPGAPVRVHVDPPVEYLELVNRARTGPARERDALRVDRVAAGAREQVVVAGTLPAGGAPRAVARSVADPTRYAGAVAKMQLAAAGVAVDGAVQLGRAPADATRLHAFRGLPLSEIVVRFMKWSNNQIGEGLLKALSMREASGRGTFAAGATSARGELVRLGLPVEGLVFEDGSGLSYHNRVSPRTLVEALRLGRRSFGFGAELIGSLPIAGLDGTLRERADDARARVRAKTGLLTRVSALSGLAEGPGGEVLAFSVLVNGFRGSASGAMRALDRFVAELTRPE